MSNDGVDLGRRRVLTVATAVVGAVGAGFAAVPFIKSWLPSAKALSAGAPVEVDLSKLQPGEQITVAYRGKPVVIVRRTQQVLTAMESLATELKDPASDNSLQPEYAKNTHRSRNPEYFVAERTCTHLRCIPVFHGEATTELTTGGFYCPCHGSKFDLAGRVYSGVPAPANLDIPPYSFTGEHTLIIGVDEKGGA